MAQFKNKFKTSHIWFFMESTNIWNILNHRKAFQLFLKVISFPSTAYVYTLSFFPTDIHMYVCMYIAEYAKYYFLLKVLWDLKHAKVMLQNLIRHPNITIFLIKPKPSHEKSFTMLFLAQFCGKKICYPFSFCKGSTTTCHKTALKEA